MLIEISNKKLQDTPSDAKIVFVINKNLFHRWIEDKEELDLLGFKGENEEATFINTHKIIYVGCESLEADDIRLACAKALECIKKTNIKTTKYGALINKLRQLSSVNPLIK